MHGSLATLLVADSNIEDRQRTRDYLEQEGFLVREAADGQCLLADLQEEAPHLVLLDLQLPGVGGLELCRRIKRYGDIPLVILTAIDDEETKLAALDLYAEDYMLKPAKYAELAVRLRGVLRRTSLSCLPVSSSVCIDERLSLDFLRREARTPEGVFRLTPLESKLLQLLVRNAGQILPTEILLERLWGPACSSGNGLWEYIRRVRLKIGDDAARPRYILNEPGLGYRFSRLIHSNDGGD